METVGTIAFPLNGTLSRYCIITIATSQVKCVIRAGREKLESRLHSLGGSALDATCTGLLQILTGSPLGSELSPNLEVHRSSGAIQPGQGSSRG